jgi:hypothetical protein
MRKDVAVFTYVLRRLPLRSGGLGGNSLGVLLHILAVLVAAALVMVVFATFAVIVVEHWV